MTNSRGGGERQSSRGLLRRLWVCLFIGLLTGFYAPPARAALQFDVFLGYQGIVREANWFPVSCEIFNDGPSFTGVFELTTDQGTRGQVRRMVLELPTNTRKRFVMPVFGSAGRYASWTARLLDDRGRVRAENVGIRPTKETGWNEILLGALPRTFGGLPAFPEARGNNRADTGGEVARLQAEYFPDTVLPLEGLDAIYLNSEKALELKVPQVNALMAWLNEGGHLIVGVEQVTDITGTPWLLNVVPVNYSGVVNLPCADVFQGYLRAYKPNSDNTRFRNYRTSPNSNSGANPYYGLSADKDFEGGSMPVASGTVRNGRTILSAQGQPLIVQANRGRGMITVLSFSPEREPFRSWKNKAWFWPRVMDAPPDAFSGNTVNPYSGQSLDGVFGALIDSRQVRKLPVSWLLLLLVIYLLVIGPLDQYWLKKINRQMLTWITFPCYVVLFSVLIYWIGFMLRAGETEWNELNVVDVLPRGERSELRGRTYASIYSPSNSRYELASDLGIASLRGEFLGQWNGNQDSSRASVDHHGDGFHAEVFVPVWTSQLYVSDWLQPGATPLRAAVTRNGNSFDLKVENLLDHKLTDVRLAISGNMYTIGELAAHEVKQVTLSKLSPTGLAQFVRDNGGDFSYAAQQRRGAFGDNQAGRLANPQVKTVAASFVSYLSDAPQQNNYNGYQNQFMYPNGSDLSYLVQRGDAVLLAWDGGHSLNRSLNQFSPRRTDKNTLLRLAVPVAQEGSK